jgi:hypothetical protein
LAAKNRSLASLGMTDSCSDEKWRGMSCQGFRGMRGVW